MLKIGDFAALSRVTVKTLRHYAEIGLLKPVWTDRFTGYRYYSMEQLPRLHRILALKDLGFTLDQVGELLDENLTIEQLHSILCRKKTELEARLRAEQNRLELVAARLKLIEQEGLASNQRAGVHPSDVIDRKEIAMQPKIVVRPAFSVVGLCYHGKNQNQEIAAMWGQFNQRAGEVKSNNAAEAFGVCSMPAGLPEGHFEYVAGFQVAEDTPVPEGMVKRSLPETKYAVFEHVGPLATLGETYRNIYQTWLPQAGLQPAENDMDMEVYDDRFKDFAPDSVMYLYIPVK